ncbi:MAG: hypothetical protein IKP64_08215 [Selenomonadaceae bacterium]|nr:hypothetical protein [Selenomonadaceae bacterium]
MGDTYERDGVTYSAMTDAVLNLDDDEKVSRLASGKVTVVVTSKINLQLTIDATDGETTFTLTGDGESLTLVKVLPFEPDNGTFTLAGNVLTAAEGSDLVVGSGALVGHDHADADITYTITDTTLTADTEQETVKFDLTSDSGTKSVTVIVNGKIINNLTNSNFTITKNSSMSLIVGKYIAKATAKSDATSQILLGTDGINIVPGSGDGALNVAVSRDGHEIISGDLECTSGSIKIGSDDSISLKKGTSFTFTQNDYTATITAIDDATTAISIGTDGITFTPNTGDGTLDFTIKNSSSSMTANVEILSGSFTFGENGALTVEKGTELKIKFSDDYVVNFKATGDAGGTISLGADGITFAPNSGDGSLDISITRNGETRTANLNMTGSLTYKLDGSISWTQGTVIKSFFDDDSSLTITANKNSDAKIIFSPQDGLSITPSVPDALSVLLSA